MRITYTLALALLAASTALGQTNSIRISDTPARIVPVQSVESLPTPVRIPEPASPSNASNLSDADIRRIANVMQGFQTHANALTRPTTTYVDGTTMVQPATSCETGECLQIDLVDQPPPVIQTEMMTIPPQVQMVPRHVPPPQTHSLQYGFDQSYPELPVVDVDNDCAGEPHRYEIAIITVDGRPTQVLNPEPCERKRNCVHVFVDNLHNLVHGVDNTNR